MDNCEHNTTTLQQTASFYNLPFHIDWASHSFSATPDFNNAKYVWSEHDVSDICLPMQIHFNHF